VLKYRNYPGNPARTPSFPSMGSGLPIFVTARQTEFLIAHPTSLAMSLAIGRRSPKTMELSTDGQMNLFVVRQRESEQAYLGESGASVE
jgi:hypothetical protein